MQTKAVYIHIPFCNQICSYCDFCKYFYNKEVVDTFLSSLKREVTQYYKQEVLDTIYIGGGTPSCLSLEQLHQLLQVVDAFKKSVHYEFTLECNVEDLSVSLLTCLKQYGVNRLSIGVQTFHSRLLNILGRKQVNVEEKIALARKMGFTNISVDLMYAIPTETIDELKSDVKRLLSLSVNHISTYSCMIEPHTKLGIACLEPVEEDLDFLMYRTICLMLKKSFYQHYEISNFAKAGYESRHNLTYWNNEWYYGFGMGATGYQHGIRYENVRNWNDYQKGFFHYVEHPLEKQEQMENELMLGLRKLEGVSIHQFKKRYQVSLLSLRCVQTLIKEGKLSLKEGFIRIEEENLYCSNSILVDLIGEVYEEGNI